jgi:general stress protein YciG
LSRAERENKSSEKGMARESGHPNSVSNIMHDRNHAGEKGRQGGTVWRMPKDHEISDHSCVRTPQHK